MARVSELARLQTTHIDSQRRMIHVVSGKGQRDRYTLLSQRLLLELRAYWQQCRASQPSPWLFPADHDPQRPINPGCIGAIMARAKYRAGIRKKGNIHLLRHSFATHLLEAGVELPVIQILMGHRRWEVADVFRLHGDAYRQHHVVPASHVKVMHAIQRCRTAALGGHLEQCSSCGFQRPVYNSCRNRHCPKCQSLDKAQWLDDRHSELLPAAYFHNVFTLPHEFNDLVLANLGPLCNLLFRSVAGTLQQFGADPQYGLGGQLGFTAILHTWDQKLLPHFHLHCVIAGGALAFDPQRWIPSKPYFLFPVRDLSRVFRQRFLDGLQTLFARKTLHFPGRLSDLQGPEQFQELVARARAKDWVVFSKKPFAGPQQVLDYLGRYTHRIAISNHRLHNVADGQVTFDYRDRRDGNQVKQLTCPPTSSSAVSCCTWSRPASAASATSASSATASRKNACNAAGNCSAFQSNRRPCAPRPRVNVCCGSPAWTSPLARTAVRGP